MNFKNMTEVIKITKIHGVQDQILMGGVSLKIYTTKKCALFSVVLTQEVNSFSCTADRKQAVLIENGKVLMYSSISFLWNQSQ